MYVFLYLIGPGCLSYVLRNKIYDRDDRVSLSSTILGVLVYSLIDMAITIMCLKPFNRANLTWNPDGVPIIQYGSIAVTFAIFTAVAVVYAEKIFRSVATRVGRISCYIVKRVSMQNGGRGKKIVSAVVCILCIIIAVISYHILEKRLPDDSALLPKLSITDVQPSEIMQGTMFNNDSIISLEGEDLGNTTDILVNGQVDGSCSFTVEDKQSGEEESNKKMQIMRVYIPPEYYKKSGEIEVTAQHLNRNTGKLIRSNSAKISILPAETIPLPLITSVEPDTLSVADTDEKWIVIKGDNFTGEEFVTVNGNEKDSLYDPEGKSLKVSLKYSEWCLLDNVYVNVGKKYNGFNSPVKSERFAIKVDKGSNKTYNWNNEWTKYRYIAHAMGSIDDKSYTNSLEAFEYNYELGQRVFETDIVFTADGKLMLRHDFTREHYGIQNEDFEEYEQNNLPKDWNDIRSSSSYSLLRFEDLLELMRKYPDIYIVTDTKETNSAANASIFNEIVKEAKNSGNIEVLNRIAVQIYNEEMFSQIMNIYPFSSVIYTLYQTNASDVDVINFVKNTGISAVTCSETRYDENLAKGLHDLDCPLYVQTINNPDKIKKYGSLGVYGFYSDDLGDYNCSISINELNDQYYKNKRTYLEDDTESNEVKENYNALKQYLKQLNNDNYVTVMSVNYDGSTALTDELHRILNSYGIEKTSLSDKGYSFTAILDGRECISQQYSDTEVVDDKWVNNIHIIVKSLGYAFDSGSPYSSIIIDGVEQSMNAVGLNIVVYDKRLGRVIDSTCYNLHDNYQLAEATG